MAYIAAGPIQTRVRQVLEQAAGSLRTISAGSYIGGFPEGDDDMEGARAAVEGARVEARVLSVRRSPASPPIIGNVSLYEMRWRIKVQRLLDRTTQIDDAIRDAVKALAFQDADVLCQALGYPGNLATTTAGTATGIVSGMLSYLESSSDVRGPIDDGASIIETDHLFVCTVRGAPQVTP
jgi:hypothetical protein